MSDKTRTTVNIGGQEYALAGFESEEYIHRVAICVDRKMNELASQYPGLSTNMLAVLTAINLADETIKAKEYAQAMEAEVSVLREEVKRLKIESALTKEGGRAKQQAQPNVTRVFDSVK